jgi:TPR repeat protein
VDAGLDAQYTLSSMYKHGHGVQQNDHHATIWWRKANDTAKALARIIRENEDAEDLFWSR